MTIIAISWASVVYLFLIGLVQHERRLARQERERLLDKWAADRRDLLDRIQAPSFEAYAGKILREKKVEQVPEGKEEQVEFIS